jgi:hypothetical protein
MEACVELKINCRENPLIFLKQQIQVFLGSQVKFL